MIITLKKDADRSEIDKMINELENENCVSITMITGENYNVFGLVGETTKHDEKHLKSK